MSRSVVKIHLSSESDLLYLELLSREMLASPSVDQILQMGLEKLLGKETLQIQYEAPPEEQLRSQRLVVADLENRLAQETSKLQELKGMLREYQRDRASVESVLPVLERQVMDLKLTLGLEAKTPPRFIKEESS